MTLIEILQEKFAHIEGKITQEGVPDDCPDPVYYKAGQMADAAIKAIAPVLEDIIGRLDDLEDLAEG